MIHALEFFDEDGELIGLVRPLNYPRAGCIRDIHIGKDEKVVGICQQKDYGTRALGFICMHTGNGYPEQNVDLNAADLIPQEQLVDLNIRPSNAIVKAKHAFKEENQSLATNHNLIWPKLLNDSDTWNKWYCK